MNSIFEYSDYREYLGDFYAQSKQLKPGFSYRSFSIKAGLPSAMHFKLVMSGQRNLSHKSIPKFLKGLGLKGKEAQYFENLVYYCQAEKTEEKMHFLERTQSLRKGRLAKKLGGLEQNVLYTPWWNVLIYELAQTKDFSEDPKKISQRLRGIITPAQAARSVQSLEENKLLVRNASGKLKPQAAIVNSEDETVNILVRDFNRRMIDESKNRIDDPLEDREYGSVTVSTTPEKLQALKFKIKEFMKDANALLTCEDNEATELVQLNLQCFRVSAKLKE